MGVMGPEFLARLMDDHAAALVLYAGQWCSTAGVGGQEAFVKLAAQAQAPPESVPWLYRVVRNAAISAGRSEQRRRVHESRAAARAPAWFVHSEGAGLDAAAATAALQGLPALEREVLVARLWGGLTFEQIAALTRSEERRGGKESIAGR